MEIDINKKVYCQICGRQIVYYPADNDRCVGPAKDGCLVLGPGKYACPQCTPYEKKFGA